MPGAVRDERGRHEGGQGGTPQGGQQCPHSTLAPGTLRQGRPQGLDDSLNVRAVHSMLLCIMTNRDPAWQRDGTEDRGNIPPFSVLMTRLHPAVAATVSWR